MAEVVDSNRVNRGSRCYSVFPKQIFVGAGIRSPIGKFGGSLRRFSAPQLGTLVLKEAIRRAPDSCRPDWVIVGHARQAGAGPNTARQIGVFAGLSEEIPAITVNQACASGLTAVFTAIEKIALGRAHSIWAGGTESMSNTPYLLPQSRWGHRLGHGKVVDGMYQDGFHCPMADMVMGETVETYLARELKISRQDQDEFALLSQQRASSAWGNLDFQHEVFEIKSDDGTAILAEDEHRRGDTTLVSLSKLPPVFDPKNGSITAGNSSGITDGAAFVHVSDRKHPWMQAEVLDFETVALDPKRMGLGPVPAIQNLLVRQGLKVEDIDVIEVNEAFAAQVLACQRYLKIPVEKLNPRGGAIAIGHPIGATGARILVTLLHQLKGRSGALGIASLCVSGGQGAAVLIRSI